MAPAALLLALAIAAFYILRSVKIYSSLKHFRGHWSAGWSRIWLLRTQGSGQMNKIFTAVNDQYGEHARPRVPSPLFSTRVAHKLPICQASVARCVGLVRLAAIARPLCDGVPFNANIG